MNNTNNRPALSLNLNSKTFRDFYYLKEELIEFCRDNNLPVSGGKIEITERIAYFLETGKVMTTPKKVATKNKVLIISEDRSC